MKNVTATINFLGDLRFPLPSGIAITPDGKYVYVTRSEDDSVWVISTATNEITDSISGEYGPHGVAFTPDGKFAYVTLDGDNSVSVIGVDSYHTAIPTPTSRTTANQSPTTAPTQTHDSPSPTVPEYHFGIAIVPVFVVVTLVLAFVGRKCSKTTKG